MSSAVAESPAVVERPAHMSERSNAGTGPEAAPSQSPVRHRSIDLVRGIAVICMIAAHAADAFLADTFTHNDLWYGFDILAGFMAPAFLLLGGVTLWLALERAGDDPSALSRFVRRALVLLLLGYWLQIPVLSLRQLVWIGRPDELHRLFDTNILQVIALAMLGVLGLRSITGSLDRVRRVAGAIGLIVVIATPYIRDASIASALPLPVRSFVAPQPESTFPLFPYLAYFLLGFGSAPLLPRLESSARTRWAALLLGAALLAVMPLLDTALTPPPPHDNFWGSSIQHLLFRVGGIVLLVVACTALARRLPSRRTWLERIGTHSLAIYLLHLVLIYGSPVSMGMRYWMDGSLNGTLTPPWTICIAIAILGIVSQAVEVWARFESRRPRAARILLWCWWGSFLAIFLLNP